MIKNFPIKKPYYYDTPQGVDHVTKKLEEDNIENLTPFKKDQLDKLNRDMKLSLLKSEEATLKEFKNDDPKSYPSDPVQRGKLMNIQALEKSLNIRPDSWKRFVKTGAIPIGKKEPDLWTDVIYPGMSPVEKGKWNLEQRKKGYDGRTGEKLPKPVETFKPAVPVVDVEIPYESPAVVAPPEKSIEEIIKEKADERLKKEQEFYDRKNGTDGIVNLLRPE
jgi:hypothetical protein|tara:strand:+ start:793 stop:1452 length:660 start_codon:yes stop_codon:yes gene_type:complete